MSMAAMLLVSTLFFVLNYKKAYFENNEGTIKYSCSCREEKNHVFWFGAQFISTLNFTQSG